MLQKSPSFSFSDKVIKIGIFNNKGGVGKTTSVINIAYFLHKHNKNVLVVDCDTQENCLNFFMTGNKENTYFYPTLYTNIYHTTFDIYSNLDNVDSDISFDYILFDLPPTISEDVRTVLRECDKIYVPTILGEFEIAGLARVTDEIHKLNVKLGGIFITMYQADTDEQLVDEVRNLLQDRLMNTIIPYSKTVRESQKNGLPIEEYFESKGTPKTKNTWKIVDAYNALTEEILRG